MPQNIVKFLKCIFCTVACWFFGKTFLEVRMIPIFIRFINVLYRMQMGHSGVIITDHVEISYCVYLENEDVFFFIKQNCFLENHYPRLEISFALHEQIFDLFQYLQTLVTSPCVLHNWYSICCTNSRKR